MELVQVFQDGERLREASALVLEDRHERLRIERLKLGRELLAPVPAQMHGAVFVREALEIERDTHAKRRGATKVIVKYHAGPGARGRREPRVSRRDAERDLAHAGHGAFDA